MLVLVVVLVAAVVVVLRLLARFVNAVTTAAQNPNPEVDSQKQTCA